MFGRLGRIWLARQIVPDDERAAIERHLRALDRLGEDLDVLDREIARAAIEDLTVKRLLTITGVNLIVAAGLAAPIKAATTRRPCLRPRRRRSRSPEPRAYHRR